MDISEILNKLTLKQKVQLVCGKDLWHTATFDEILDELKKL